jgi:hypothetical protein
MVRSSTCGRGTRACWLDAWAYDLSVTPHRIAAVGGFSGRRRPSGRGQVGCGPPTVPGGPDDVHRLARRADRPCRGPSPDIWETAQP